MELLKINRGQLKSRLTRFKTYFNKISESDIINQDDLSELIERLENIKPINNEYQTLHLKIMHESQDASHEQELETFENTFFQITSKASVFIKKNSSPQSNTIVGTNTNSIQTHNEIALPMPNIALPVFSGKFEDWVEFRDAFDAMINKNSKLNNMQRFYYLTNSLKGEAAQKIKNLKICEENYSAAWETLSRKYENKKLAVNNNLRALFNLENVKRDTYSQLQNFLDELLKIMHVLKQYEQPSIDTLLIYIISSKLTPFSRQEWESKIKKETFPTFQEFLDFIDKRCDLLGSLEANKGSQSLNPINNYQFKSNNSRAYVGAIKHTCPYCKQNHNIFNCENFIQFDIHKRIAEIKRLHLCVNCLKRNHSNYNCTAPTCKKCNRKHHTLLHIEFNNQNGTGSDINAPSSSNCLTVENSNHNTQTIEEPHNAIDTPNQISLTTQSKFTNATITQTLLSTANVQILDNHGKTHICRVLLDPGSQVNFITTKLADQLGLSRHKYNLTVSGISTSKSNIRFRTKFIFKSCVNEYKAEVSCSILDQITDNLPITNFDLKALQIPPHITLADSKAHLTNKIDILLGADTFWDLLCVGQHKLGKGKPVLQKTKLGWILGGSLALDNQTETSLVCYNAVETNKINVQLQKFWELEECQDNLSLYTPEEQFCEDHFIQTTTRDTNGRFIVNIPLKGNPNELGDSKRSALKRFYSLERKLSNNVTLKEEYSKFLEEYETLGHMTKINEESLNSTDKYYLPHHAVTKSFSSTTKTRVVFDGSAKTSSGISLNDLQCVGPVIQNNLFSILIRFRIHTYVITADVEKMYRQILVNPNQRNLQLILWRHKPELPISCYQLNTITYGTASASFLAVRCLKQLSLEYQSKYTKSCQAIANDFYVDDLLTGADTIHDVIKLQSEISKILSSGGFQLRKWISNDNSILNHINKGETAMETKSLLANNDESRTLGVLWAPRQDNLQYNIHEFNENRVITKRSILSVTSQIFDPLGLLGPVIVQAKLILQILWQEKISWDESLSMNLYTKWITFQNQLQHLKSIKIQRPVICKNPILIEMHGFCDASEVAYGACVYIRSVNSAGIVQTNLLCAKSRVAPLKKVSLPRLELCGAQLLARLMNQVNQSLNIQFNSHFCWCDSTITLSWIKSAPSRWKTFVANRAAEIQNLSKQEIWRHIKSEDNQADLLSRGMSSNQIQISNLWWHGPKWLNLKAHDWPVQNAHFENNLEVRAKSHVIIDSQFLSQFSKFSSLYKLQRIAAYCFRFLHNLRVKSKYKLIGPLSISEIRSSLHKLVKVAQQEMFACEIRYLTRNQHINNNSSLLSLNPFIDKEGLLRVGGRLRHSNFAYDKKHPIILPSAHWLTKLICRTEHIRLLHCGANQLLSSLRDHYWPIAAKNLLRKIVHECISCFRAKPRSIQPIMGDLPKIRITESPAFYNCGVDYAGPVMIKNKKGRGSTLIKSYICIFVCCSTKAHHLELVTDLTTETFLAALRRFVSRRGQPANIYSDNGSNFIGANSELKELNKFLSNQSNQNDIINLSKLHNTIWHFIPPRSPHFGGQWEAGVKSVKYHLKRLTSNAFFTFEEYYTLLTQIEAVLNSRPISSLSNDPTDFNPLTPAHFLIGRKLTALPEGSYMEINDNRLSKYEQIQKIRQHFWRRWNKEYIHELQVRSKSKSTHTDTLREGTLVLIKEDGIPPMKWKLGRVTQLHPGTDGVTRVVSIRVATGLVIKRAVCKVCALPINNIDEPN